MSEFIGRLANRPSARLHKFRSGARLVLGGLLAASISIHPIITGAQDYPTKPIRMVVGFAPGSTTDTLARLIAAKMAKGLGRQIVVDNRVGAGGNIAAELVAKAPADGYTLLTVPSSHAINPALYPDLAFDAVTSFAPIGVIGSAPLLIVANPALAASSLRELIELAKSKPAALNYASGGSGSPSHLTMELLKSMAGIDLVHVPFKGGTGLLTSVIAGDVQLTASGLLIAMPLVKAGRLKAIAVTGPKRVAIAPEVPTVAESGVPGYVVTGWWGVLAPAGTPPAIIARLNRELMQALEAPDLRERLSTDGIDVGGGTPDDFAAFIKRELTTWSRVVRESGARVE